MTCRILLTACFAAQMTTSSVAFTAHSMTSSSSTAAAMPMRTAPLQVSTSSISEQEASYMMAKARECAFNDSCSIEESNVHLLDVLTIQEACASGIVAGQNVCEDQQEVAEIVAHLREHVKNGAHGLTPRQDAFYSGALFPLAFLTLTLASMAVVSAANPTVASFTFQEVMWAARDGYLDDLVHHFLQNGGLLVADADMVPFTGQELMWAVRDGYLPSMIHHYMQNGGL